MMEYFMPGASEFCKSFGWGMETLCLWFAEEYRIPFSEPFEEILGPVLASFLWMYTSLSP